MGDPPLTSILDFTSYSDSQCLFSTEESPNYLNNHVHNPVCPSAGAFCADSQSASERQFLPGAHWRPHLRLQCVIVHLKWLLCIVLCIILDLVVYMNLCMCRDFRAYRFHFCWRLKKRVVFMFLMYCLPAVLIWRLWVHLHMHALVIIVLFACMNAEVVYFKHNLCYIILLCNVLFFYMNYQFHSCLFLIKANQVCFFTTRDMTRKNRSQSASVTDLCRLFSYMREIGS